MGTLNDIKTKLHMRKEGAFKRERAIAYSLAQKVLNWIAWPFWVLFCFGVTVK